MKTKILVFASLAVVFLLAVNIIAIGLYQDYANTKVSAKENPNKFNETFNFVSKKDDDSSSANTPVNETKPTATVTEPTPAPPTNPTPPPVTRAS